MALAPCRSISVWVMIRSKDGEGLQRFGSGTMFESYGSIMRELFDGHLSERYTKYDFGIPAHLPIRSSRGIVGNINP